MKFKYISTVYKTKLFNKQMKLNKIQKISRRKNRRKK